MQPHPQPQPLPPKKPLPPPQKQESSRIQMIHSQPSLPPKKPLPQPHPQLLPRPLLPLQQHSSRRIQIQLPHPQPLFWELTHPQESLEQPQFVAVKSLISFSSKGLFMLYSMREGMSMFLEEG